MKSAHEYESILSQQKALVEGSEAVREYLDLEARKTALEAILKAEARDYGSYESDLLNIKVSMPKPKLKANLIMVQELASPEEWDVISRQAMDYEVDGAKLKTLIEQKLVGKKMEKAIEVIEPTPAVTIKLK